MKNLHTQYKPERQKTKSGTGADETYISMWPYLEALRFLEEFVAPKKNIKYAGNTHVQYNVSNCYKCQHRMKDFADN